MDKITAKAQMIIRKPPATVFDAFVDAHTMSKFWFTRRDDGLKQGETISWYVGQGEDAPSVEVRVEHLQPSEKIQIQWGHRDQFTQVNWHIEKTIDGHSILTIEESGFTGSNQEIIKQALDSTGGFNQVIVALKSLLEHNATVNIVTDHV